MLRRVALRPLASTDTMADDSTTSPKVEDINLDGADDGADETMIGEDGAPIKLSVRFERRLEHPLSTLTGCTNLFMFLSQAGQKKRLRAKRKKAAEDAAAGMFALCG